MSDGLDGLDGLSAYELAIAYGFRGTEQDWLGSLKGAQGEQGPQGEPGQPGADADPQSILAVVAEAISNLPRLSPVSGGERGLAEPVVARTPWRLRYMRDEPTSAVRQIVAGPVGGAPEIVFVPRRNEYELIETVDVMPYQGDGAVL